LGTTSPEKPIWYDVSEVPSAAIVRSLLLSENCTVSLSRMGSREMAFSYVIIGRVMKSRRGD
jgi:hypothetical protein